MTDSRISTIYQLLTDLWAIIFIYIALLGLNTSRNSALYL
jgi:hypothetical protein